jgi:exosome complex protein LRP1
MDKTNVLSLIEQLDDEIDNLEESLAPLVKTALSETASKLPLLDKAKLYVLVTYAIESILFCGLPVVQFIDLSNNASSVSAT